jgi:hypothetical protein
MTLLTGHPPMRAVHSRQSQENAMSKLSRRSLVSSAAALPALTVPAIANALPVGADIELLQLGVRLLRIKRELNAMDAITDGQAYDDAFEVVNGQLCALMDPIYSLTATTIDGLAVQAVAVTIAAAELWDVDPDQEPELQIERRFIEAVCRYTGVEHPPINIEHLKIMAALDKNGSPAPSDKVAEIADKMLVEYDRLGTPGRDIEAKDWDRYDTLHGQLWEIPAQSIAGVIGKARVLDQRLRCGGEPHSVLDQGYAWKIVDDLLALGVQS